MYNVAILYGIKFGLMDARGIKESHDNGFAKKFIIFISYPPIGSAKELLDEMHYCEIRITSRPLKDAKIYKRDCEDACIYPLDEFGERGVNRDFD